MGADPGMLSLVMKFVADAQQFIAENKKAEASGVATTEAIKTAYEKLAAEQQRASDLESKFDAERQKEAQQRTRLVELTNDQAVAEQSLADAKALQESQQRVEAMRTEAINKLLKDQAQRLREIRAEEASRVEVAAVVQQWEQRQAATTLRAAEALDKQTAAYARSQAAAEEFSVRGVFPLLTNFRTLARVATGILAIGIIVAEWDRFTDALKAASLAIGGFGEAAQKAYNDNIKYSEQNYLNFKTLAEGQREIREQTNLTSQAQEDGVMRSQALLASYRQVGTWIDPTGISAFLNYRDAVKLASDAQTTAAQTLDKLLENMEKLRKKGENRAEEERQLEIIRAQGELYEGTGDRVAALQQRLEGMHVEETFKLREVQGDAKATADIKTLYGLRELHIIHEISAAQEEAQEKNDKAEGAKEKKEDSAWEHRTEQRYAFYAKRRKEAEADEKYWAEAGARAKKEMQENIPKIPTDLGVGGAIADAKFKLADTYKDMMEAQRHFATEMAAEGDRARLHELSVNERYLRHQIEMHGKTAVFYREEAKQLLAFETEKLQIHERAEERRITEDAIREQKRLTELNTKQKNTPGMSEPDRVALQQRTDELVAQSKIQAAAKIKQAQKEEGDSEKEVAEIYKQAAREKMMADAASVEASAARLLGITGHKKAEAYLNMVMATAEGIVKLAEKDYVGAALDFMGAAEYGIIAGQTHGKGGGGGGAGAESASRSRSNRDNQPGVVMGQGGASRGGSSSGYSQTTINVTGGMISADTMQQFAAKFGVGQGSGLYRINANSTSSLPASRA